jgi:hypothetical protein
MKATLRVDDTGGFIRLRGDPSSRIRLMFHWKEANHG